MDFDLSDEQRLLEQTLRRLLAEAAPPARVREIMKGEAAHDPKLWAQIAELGVAGMLVPESHGGGGLALLDAAIAMQAFGHAATPAPFLATSVLAPVALAAGTPAQQKTWLPRIAAGDAQIGVAATEIISRHADAGGAALPPLEHVGTGADRIDSEIVCRVGGVLRRQQGQPWRKLRRQPRRWRREMKPGGQRVNFLDRLDHREVPGDLRGGFRILDMRDREGHRRGIERFTVVEGDARLEFQFPGQRINLLQRLSRHHLQRSSWPKLHWRVVNRMHD